MTRSRSRTKVRTLGYAQILRADGTHWTWLSEPDGGFTTVGIETCVDVDDQPGFDHPLDIVNKEYRTPKISGKSATTFNNITASAVTNKWGIHHPHQNQLPSLPFVNWTYYTNKAMANMNPGKPIVDLPLFLWELRELPRALRELGDLLGGHLKPWQIPDGWRKLAIASYFGWGPLISDLVTLLKISALARDQNRLINDSLKGKRLSRKIGHSQMPIIQTGNYQCRVPVQSNPACVQAEGYWKFTGFEDAWYTARLILLDYAPDTDVNPYDIIDALGFYPNAATLWNSVPWTWLIDWLIGIGDYFEAKRGNIRFSIKDLNIMVKQDYVGKFNTTFLKSGQAMTKVERRVTYKGRRQPVPVYRTVLSPYPFKGVRSLILALIVAPRLGALLRQTSTTGG